MKRVTLDFSVSLLIEFACFKAYFGGDTHESVEAIIEAENLVTDVDLYKAKRFRFPSPAGSDRIPTPPLCGWLP